MGVNQIEKAMKSLLVLLGTLAMMQSSSFASTGVLDASYNNTPEGSAIRKKIERVIGFPVTSNIPEEEVTVEIVFRVSSEGELQLIEADTTNTALLDYVAAKLRKIKLDKNDPGIGEVITDRFVFRKQA